MIEQRYDAADYVTNALSQARVVIESLNVLSSEIVRAARILSFSLASGGQVLTCGNGGSAADALHLTAELVGRYERDRAPLASTTLGCNLSSLTAIANDYGYDRVFSRQLGAIARPGDVLVAISTSGASPSVLNAIHAARDKDVRVVGLTGGTPAAMMSLCDCCIEVGSVDTPRIQEAHALLLHMLCGIVELDMFGSPPSVAR